MEEWEIVLKGSKRFRELLQREAERYGLSYSDVQVLYFLSQEGELNVSRLATLVDVNKSTMVEILDKLERDNLIIRNRDTVDRRVVKVRVTDMGLTVLKEVRAKYKDLIEDLLSKVDREKVIEFFKIIISETKVKVS
ncbi:MULTISPECIES: MarR family winged helix-turn-helix transcriptional regulator [Acidianus]|nr:MULTISPECIES: MarR family transcriptional regulator [Acidianus]NON61156.1 MarR family transcriptional regulator [Acidianus sp. RZ1]